jgi:hypothetical protein
LIRTALKNFYIDQNGASNVAAQHLVGTLFDQFGRFGKEEKEIGAQQETNPGALSDQYRKG